MLIQRIGFRLIIVVLLLSLGCSAALSQELKATVESIEAGNLVTLKLEHAPTSLGTALILKYNGKEIGRLVSPQLIEQSVFGVFQPKDNFKIQEGMELFLTFKPPDEPSLELKVLQVKGSVVKLSGGNDRGVKQGDYFQLYAGETKVGEVAISNVEDKEATGGIVERYGNIADATSARQIPAPENLPRGPQANNSSQGNRKVQGIKVTEKGDLLTEQDFSLAGEYLDQGSPCTDSMYGVQATCFNYLVRLQIHNSTAQPISLHTSGFVLIYYYSSNLSRREANANGGDFAWTIPPGEGAHFTVYYTVVQPEHFVGASAPRVEELEVNTPNKTYTLFFSP